MKLLTTVITFLSLNKINYNLASNLSNVRVNDVCDSRDKICLWQCCPPGQRILRRTCRTSQSNTDFYNITVYDEQLETSNKSFEDVFQLAYGIMSDSDFAQNSFYVGTLFNLYLVENGNLYLELPNTFMRWQLVTADHFCVGIHAKTNRTVILAELKEEISYHVENLEYALSVTITFLLTSIEPYCLFSQLRDLDGVILILFTIFFTVPFVLRCCSLYTIYSVNEVYAIALFYHFFSISSYCWTNVMFYRIRTSTSHEHVTTSSCKRFLKYCGYTIVLPLLLAKLTVAVDLIDLTHLPWFVTPQIVSKASYLFETKESLYYLHIPIILLLIYNWVVCSKLLVEWYQKPRTITITAMVEDESDLRSPLNRPGKYVTLLILLTLHSAVQVLSAYCPDGTGSVLVHVIFITTLCIGPAIFVTFIVDKNVLAIVKNNFIKLKPVTSVVVFKNEE